MPLADSVTTWSLAALASTRDGRVTSAHREVVASFREVVASFREVVASLHFQVDVDLPVAVTQGDEIAVDCQPMADLYDFRVEVQSDGRDDSGK